VKQHPQALLHLLAVSHGAGGSWAKSDGARQPAFSFGFVNFTEPHKNKLKMVSLSGLGYKKYNEIRK